MIILTGGAGFIGSAFLETLNARGVNEILVVDNLGASDKWMNLRGKRFIDYIHKDAFLELIEGDYSFTEDGEIDAIVHLGACSSTTERDAEYMLHNNYHYSKSLIEWGLRQGSRIVYASSAATYGDGAQGFQDDISQLDSLRPLNIYGYSKHLVDQWAMRSGYFNHIAGLKFFNVFGPNEYHKGEMTSVVYKAFHQIRERGSLGLFRSYREDFKDGEQQRDFVYIKDCCEVIWWLLENRTANGLFNLGSGKARSWNDLAQAIFAAMNQPAKINYIDMPMNLRDRYQYFTEASMEKLKDVGCPVKFRSLEESVSDYVVNHLAKPDPYL